MKNVFRDMMMAINRRPELGTIAFNLGTSSPGDGHYWWDKKGYAVVVSNGRIWRYNSAYDLVELSNGSSLLASRGKCTFAEAKETASNTVYLLIANGGRIVYTDGTAAGATKLDGVSDPVECTHVIQINGYVLANDKATEETKNKWFATAVNEPLNFAGGQDYTAPMQADDILAIMESRGRAIILGRQTIEPWQDTLATIPWARVNGSLINIGIFSADSVTKYNEDIYFMSNKREIMLFRADSYIPISSPYNKFIQQLTTINDTHIEVVSSFEGYDFLLIHFPSEDITLAHNITLYNISGGEINDWYEWTYWEDNQHKQFRGINHIYAASFGKHLICDRTNGNVYEFERSAYSDFGNTIKIEVVTGNITHGTLQEKDSKWIIFRFKRGEGANKKILLYYRDDGDSEWGNVLEHMETGALGARQAFIKIYNMGIYRSRQYKFVMGDAADFVLIEIEEAFTIIG